MIKIISKEGVRETEGKKEAIHGIVIKIFGLPIFKRINSTTHNEIIQSLSQTRCTKIKGFGKE